MELCSSPRKGGAQCISVHTIQDHRASALVAAAAQEEASSARGVWTCSIWQGKEWHGMGMGMASTAQQQMLWQSRPNPTTSTTPTNPLLQPNGRPCGGRSTSSNISGSPLGSTKELQQHQPASQPAIAPRKADHDRAPRAAAAGVSAAAAASTGPQGGACSVSFAASLVPQRLQVAQVFCA